MLGRFWPVILSDFSFSPYFCLYLALLKKITRNNKNYQMLFQKLGGVFKDFGGFSQTQKPKKTTA